MDERRLTKRRREIAVARACGWRTEQFGGDSEDRFRWLLVPPTGRRSDDSDYISTCVREADAWKHTPYFASNEDDCWAAIDALGRPYIVGMHPMWADPTPGSHWVRIGNDDRCYAATRQEAMWTALCAATKSEVSDD